LIFCSVVGHEFLQLCLKEAASKLDWLGSIVMYLDK
jgi:hypothetical protein